VSASTTEPIAGGLGYVDLHVHGGGGGSVEDGPAGIFRLLATHGEHGTVRCVLSLVAAPLPRLVDALVGIRRLAATDGRIAGAHLEGPFLAPARRGAHDGAHLIPPTSPAVDKLLAAGEGVLRMITIAPELPGAIEAIERFAAAGVLVAVGHTEASASQTRAAFDAGASVLTHAFNAMPAITAGEPGPLGAALADERVSIEVIADGIHVPPDGLRWLFESAPGRVVLVSDAMAAAGAGDGDYRLGGIAVEVRGGRATVAGTDRLAGSTLTLDRAIETAVSAGVARDVAVAAASTIPGRLLGD
jgi:N-acetylglucosamine-6-phosphate deacetylase